MNILKTINIKGEIFAEYAFLSYTFSFCEGADSPVSAEYLFALPKGAQLSALRIMYDGKMIAAKVTSTTHAARLSQGEDAFAVLRAAGEGEYLLSLGAVGEKPCKLLLNIYAPLEGGRLTIPLAKGFGGGLPAAHTALIDLNIKDMDRAAVSSPTHKLLNDGSMFSTGEVPADRDFCIDVRRADKVSSAIAVKNITGGEMLCRLYPHLPQRPYTKKLLIVYDASGGLTGAASQTAREFVYGIAKAFDGEYAVTTQDNMLTDGFVKSDDKTLGELLQKLSHIDISPSGLSAVYVNPDTEIILVTGAAFDINSFPQGVHVVTFGEVRAPFGEHIYSGDNAYAKAEEILARIRRRLRERVEVLALGAQAHIIDSDDGITVYLRYTGRRPSEVKVRCGEYCVTESLEDIRVYDSFAPIGLLCAREISRSLEEELISCPPERVPEIRRRLEETGIKYSALNSETALLAPLGTKTAAIKVIIPNSAEGGSLKSAPSMFRERETLEPSEGFALQCVNYIIKSMRSDGAICGSGEIASDIRKRQTLICFLALVLLDIPTEHRDFADRAESFLSGYSFNGIELTYDKGEAYRLLAKVFGEKSYIPEDKLPDILTAARAVWQAK